MPIVVIFMMTPPSGSVGMDGHLISSWMESLTHWGPWLVQSRVCCAENKPFTGHILFGCVGAIVASACQRQRACGRGLYSSRGGTERNWQSCRGASPWHLKV